MDEFVKRSIDQLLEFKKNIFKHKHAVDFIEKLTRRGDMKVIESELNKCLLPKSKKLSTVLVFGTVLPYQQSC